MAGQGHRVIGVLGGMGPEATVWLMQRILAFTPADDDCDHIPLLVDSNTQVPSRIKAILGGYGEDPTPVLCDMARKLEKSGADALIMPCNTAHLYAPAIANSASIPLLNMLQLTARQAAVSQYGETNKSISRVGMLALPAVRATGVFDREIEKVALEIRYPDNADRLLACIKAVKAGRNDQHTLTILDEVIAELEVSGAQAIIIACSELSLLADQLTISTLKIDSIDVLARAAVEFSTNSEVA
ncbi:MAG: amino acid racemase [Salinisphaera sp.]|jgi:aspartate racemase|nr:amino acid racemase [Salinisphaera sp.]